MNSQKALKRIVGGLGFSALLLAATSFYISYRLLHPPRRKQEQTPKDFGLKYRKIGFKSKDGTLLKGWLIEGRKQTSPASNRGSAKKPRGLIILSHGYSWDKQSLLPAAKELYKNNYTSLLFDYRAHGESAGKKTTIGFLEQEDLISAANFSRRFSRKIGIIGISMGAATAIMGSPRIKGLTAIVADSSFADLKEIIYRKSGMLKNLIIKFMEMQGIDFSMSRPIDFAARIKVPIFFIHGEKDSIVPVEHSENLYRKTMSPKKLWKVKNAQHGRSYFACKKEYSRKVMGFLNSYFE